MTKQDVEQEKPMDRIELLSLEVRAGFAEMRASQAEMRASQAELRAELAGFRTSTNERFATVIDAIADLRNEYRGHTHDG